MQSCTTTHASPIMQIDPNINIVIYLYCNYVSPYSTSDPLYDDPQSVQLQDNPAYGTAGAATDKDVDEEDDYESCPQ